MDIELEINSVNDYANDIGARTYHPHVSIIHYDEVGKIQYTLNRFNVYALFLQKNFPSNLTYGIGTYAQENGSLLAYAPGQIDAKSVPTKLKSIKSLFFHSNVVGGVLCFLHGFAAS